MTNVECTNKKVVRSTHLSVRFYRQDGWTIDEVQALCQTPEPVVDSHLHFCDSVENSYWIVMVENKPDIDKILNITSEVIRYPGCCDKRSDREYLKSILC